MTPLAKTKAAFTIMELLIVTIIIGIMAAFAIPTYEKAMGRQKVRRLMVTANLIAGAQQIYKVKNGRYWCDFAAPCAIMFIDGDTSDINTNLGLSILPEAGVGYNTYTVTGLENTSFNLLITDGTSFLIGGASLPGDITCANIPPANVCP